MNVIIEDTGLGTVFVKQLKGIVIAKVLKLDQDVWLPLPQCSHETCYNLVIRSSCQSALLEALQGCKVFDELTLAYLHANSKWLFEALACSAKASA